MASRLPSSRLHFIRDMIKADEIIFRLNVGGTLGYWEMQVTFRHCGSWEDRPHQRPAAGAVVS